MEKLDQQFWIYITVSVMFVSLTSGIANHIKLDSDFPDETKTLFDRSNDNVLICQKGCLQKYRDMAQASDCLVSAACAKCWKRCDYLKPYRTIQTTIIPPQSFIDPWPVRVASMVKQEFLISTHLAWEPNKQIANCLVTWEVYGGGLMGNLLTESSNVELSLWPDTKYRVQVTCKNKFNEVETIKSPSLIIDTSNAIEMKPEDDMPTEQKQSTTNNWNGLVDNGNETSIDPTTNHKKQNGQRPPSDQMFIMRENFKEIVLGMCSALVVFLFVLTVFCAARDRRLNHKFQNNEILCHHNDRTFRSAHPNHRQSTVNHNRPQSHIEQNHQYNRTDIISAGIGEWCQVLPSPYCHISVDDTIIRSAKKSISSKPSRIMMTATDIDNRRQPQDIVSANLIIKIPNSTMGSSAESTTLLVQEC